MTQIGAKLTAFRFNFIAFFAGLAVGFLYIFFKEPPYKTKVIYPTPINAGKITYTDSAATCFQYVSKKVDCPDDKTLVRQHVMNDSSETT